jgi:CelD/BcsL family acetyltransferase involved in cellulose biosynthesis
MSARLMDARNKEFWPGIEEHRLGSLFSSPPWVEALARTYGFTISASTFGRNGAVESAVLFSHVSDLRGDRIVCLPFSDYCDPLVEDGAVWNELVNPILALGLPVALRCLRHEHALHDPRFVIVGQAQWHGIDLTPPEETVWAGLSKSARQCVRKAKYGGLVVREGRSLEDVRIFHRMHRHLRKTKYRLLAQPTALFENLYEQFAPEDRLTVLLAEADGVPVAGVFFLEWGGTLYYKFNASTDQTLYPNDLLMWEGIRMGQRRGLAKLDLGLSDLGQPGLIQYKRKYATEEQSITMLRWLPPGHADARGEQASRTLARITHLLTDPDVPDEITGEAGEELYRYFC